MAGLKGLGKQSGGSKSSNSIGNKSGPNQGRAFGNGSSFKNGKTTTKRDRLPSRIGPGGSIVGVLDVDGEAPRGDAQLEQREFVQKAMRQLAEEVETEPLPIEHRHHLERYRKLILDQVQGGSGDSSDGN